MENSIIKLTVNERENVLATLKTETARKAVAKVFSAETVALNKADNAVKAFALTVDEMVQNKVFELEGMKQGEFAEHIGMSNGRVSQLVGACRFLRKDAEASDKLLGDKFNIDALYQLSSVPIGTINDALTRGEIRYGMGPKAIKAWKDGLALTDGKESKTKPVKMYDVCVTVVKYGVTVNGERQSATATENYYSNMPKESFESEIAELSESAYSEPQNVKSGIESVKAIYYPATDGSGHILIQYTEHVKPIKPRKETAKDKEIAKLRAALEAAGIKV